MLLQYYGVDWLATVLTFLAIWLIGDRNKQGFYIMIAGNGCWIVLGIFTQSIALIIANLLFASLNIRAIINWSRPDSNNHAA